MNKFKTMAAVGATALMLGTSVAGTAMAQSYGYSHRGYDNYARRGYDNAAAGLNTSYVDSLEWKINNAFQERRISNGERRELLATLRDIQPLAWRNQTGQANGYEIRRLESGVARIEGAVNRYAGGYGRYGNRRW
jgi:hypothetical protein